MTTLNPWINISANSDFSIHNLPIGIFQKGNKTGAGIAIGDHIIDLHKAQSLGAFKSLELPESIFAHQNLNCFMDLGNQAFSKLRKFLQKELCTEGSILHQNQDCLIPQDSVEMQLPIRVGDYTDFYSSIEHATNVGKMFRDPENALLPNWRHIPVGYHGRASSVVVSGTNFHRPKGQVLPKGESQPVFQPCRLMDFELEMAFVIGKGNNIGTRISTEEAEEHIFGLMLFNDWSARDIQKWEYVPLGPFLGKNFCSSVSPWIVSLEALEPFRVAGPKQDPEVLPYLRYEGLKNFDIQLEVDLETENGDGTTISKSNYQYMYWNMAQQLAHHTVNGCNAQVGDLMASGTISGKEESSYGSMLELSWAGSKEITLKDGSTRKFLQDGDSVVIRGFAEKDGIRVGFGEVRGKVLPALD